MNFQQLEYALAVNKHQHFGKAADSCNITQATLSAMIKKLEEELNIVLFDRSRQPVKTTDTGVHFLSIASQILALQQDMFDLNQQQEKELEGNLTIGIIPTVANSLLPIILPTIIEDNPKLQLTIAEITTDEIIQQLTSDKIDLGILATPLNEVHIEETILYYEPMLVYGISDHGKNYISSADVKNKQIWLLEEGHCFRTQAMTICNIKEKEMNANNLNFEGSSFETLLNLTDKFGGYTLVPELYAKDMPKNRKNMTKPFQPPVPVREISLVSSRPYAKKRAIEYLSKLIMDKVPKKLTSNNMKNRDLEIIGI